MTFVSRSAGVSIGEESDVWAGLDQALSSDDPEAVTSHLAAGQCVYYVEDHTPEGLVVASTQADAES